jgi:hypothetical protein
MSLRAQLHFGGALAVRTASKRPSAAGLLRGRRVLFENSIVCLVVLFCCCFLAMLCTPRVWVWSFFDARFWRLVGIFLM